MLQLYNTNHIKVCALTDYKDYYLEQTINNDDLLFFSYPIYGMNYDRIQFECYIQNGVNEYVIKEINVQGAETGSEWVQVVCKINLEDLKGGVLTSFYTEKQTALDTANLALVSVGWEVLSSDVTSLRNVSLLHCSVYDVMSEIAKAFLCEILYDVINKYVIIHQKIGAERGTYFIEQLNLKTIQSQGHTNDYITHLIPIGKDNLGIAAVNGGLSFVSNHQYSNKIITAFWIDNRYTDETALREDAIARLAYLSKPSRAYSADIIDLANVSTEWNILDYSLGDFVTLISASKNIREKQRIIKLTRYPEEPERSTIEIVNRVASLVDVLVTLSDTTESVSNITNTDGTIVASSVNGQLTNAYIATANVGTLDATIANIGDLLATKALITDLVAINAEIDALTADKATVIDLTAATGRIGILESNSATIEQLDVVDARITNLVVTTAMINDLAVTNAKIADATIMEAKIADAAITNAKIENLAVTSAKIADATINTAKIENLAVTSAKIADATINTAKIALGAITNALIGTEAVDTAQIADGSITDAKIVTLTANKITSGTIDAAEINVINLNADNLTVGTINGQRIADESITTAKIAVGAITSDRIADGAIKESQVNWATHLLF